MTAIFAHRGCHGEGLRENTLAAFVAARREGADGVELDVRLSADGVPVVHHDAALPTGLPVANVAAAGLPAWLPTLGQAVEACRGLALNVEVKHLAGSDEGRALAVAVARLLGARCPPMDVRSPADGVLVSSFDAASLAAVRRESPSVPTGLLCDWRRHADEALAEAAAAGCAALHPFVTQATPALAAAAEEAGVALHVWTVNAPGDLEAMGALGVAAVITDRVLAAREVLHRSGGRNGDRGRG